MPARVVERLRGALASPRAGWWAAGAALLLCLPALAGGLAVDDHLHRLRVLGKLDALGSRFDLFAFAWEGARSRGAGDPFDGAWWAAPDLRLAFWRPLASLTHWLDYTLWPDAPWVMHAQSLAWYAALVLAVARLQRRLLGAGVAAGLAALLYAVDDAHGIPAGWLANRNALMAAALGVLALVAHDRWRRDGWRAGAAIAPALLAAGLLSAEAAVAACGYLAAYALLLDRGSWRARAASLLPCGAVVVVWRVAYAGLGYGATGSDLYIDPLADPGAFGAAALARAPLLLLAQLAFPPADLWLLFGARAAVIAAALAAAAVALIGACLWPLLRGDRVARFFALGAALSVLPFCATFPSDRLLLFAGIGGLGLCAQLLVGVGERAVRGRAARALAAVWLVVHGVIAPLLLPPRTLTMRYLGLAQERVARRIPQPPASARDLVLVNLPNDIVAGGVRLLWSAWGRPMPRRTRALAAGVQPVALRRLDARTLLVRPDGGFLAAPRDRIMRASSRPFSAGDRVELPGLTVDVTQATADGRPLEARFRFAVPLEDPSLAWMRWSDGGLVPFRPPAVGAAARIAGADAWSLLRGGGDGYAAPGGTSGSASEKIVPSPGREVKETLPPRWRSPKSFMP